MRNSFMTDYEKMIDFFIMPKNKFLKFYSYLSEDDYKETIHDILNTSGYWNKDWLEDNPDFDGTVLKNIILGMMMVDWFNNIKKSDKITDVEDNKYVWILDGSDDDGDWEIEIFDSYEKALEKFRYYIEDFKLNYSDAKWDISSNFASYDGGSHHGSFWIKKVEVN